MSCVPSLTFYYHCLQSVDRPVYIILLMMDVLKDEEYHSGLYCIEYGMVWYILVYSWVSKHWKAVKYTSKILFYVWIHVIHCMCAYVCDLKIGHIAANYVSHSWSPNKIVVYILLPYAVFFPFQPFHTLRHVNTFNAPCNGISIWR